jgi:AraC-like DNA-binding protein
METALTRDELMRRHRTRSSVIGAVSISMTRMPAGATVLRRSPSSDPRAVDLLLPVEASVVVRERGSEQYLVGPRELGWLPNWTPAALYAGASCEIAWIQVPSRVLDSHPGLAAPLPPRPAPGSALIEPMRAFVQTAVAGSHAVDPLSAHLFEDLLGALLEAAALEARGVQPAGGAVGGVLAGAARPTLRAQAVAHIAAFRDSPQLSPQQIARSLRISVRQLQRAFEEAGTTVAAEIRRQRLDSAIEMLTAAEFDGLTVSEIAARAGFRNDAELRRALSSWMGATPSELRSRRTLAL